VVPLPCINPKGTKNWTRSMRLVELLRRQYPQFAGLQSWVAEEDAVGVFDYIPVIGGLLIFVLLWGVVWRLQRR
jgi:hypothetical protein